MMDRVRVGCRFEALLVDIKKKKKKKKNCGITRGFQKSETFWCMIGAEG
jgi:hypothetical protein